MRIFGQIISTMINLDPAATLGISEEGPWHMGKILLIVGHKSDTWEKYQLLKKFGRVLARQTHGKSMYWEAYSPIIPEEKNKHILLTNKSWTMVMSLYHHLDRHLDN